MDLSQYSQLLDTFPASGAPEVDPKTFLEIAGYPHLENVASNILEFFFNDQAEHRLHSLFLKSLLESAGVDVTGEDLQVEFVKREVSTQTRTRLDLVISTQTLLVGIENKLFHGLNNDLNIYKDHLYTEAGERKLICILLSLDPIPPSQHKDVFIPITYAAFFENIRRNIGQVVVGADQHYLPFLFDFIQSLEHLRQEPIMPSLEYRKWVHEHQKEISTLFQEIDNFKSQMLSTMKRLRSRVDVDKHEDSGVKIKPWLYDGMEEDQVAQILVYDFELPDGLTFAMDVILSPLDWKITVVGRKSTTTRTYEDFFNKIPDVSYKEMVALGDTFEKRRLVGEKFNYDVDLALLAAKVQDLIDRIVTHASKKTKVSK